MTTVTQDFSDILASDKRTEFFVANAEQPFDEVADGIRPSHRQSLSAHGREIDGGENERETSERSDSSRKQSGDEKHNGSSDNKAGPIPSEDSTKPISNETVSNQSSDYQAAIISVQDNSPIQDDFTSDGFREAVLTSLSAKFPKKLALFSNSYSIASDNLRVLLSFEDESFVISEKQLLGIFNRFPSLLAAPLDAASVQSRIDLFRRYGVTRSAFFDLCSRSNVLLFPVGSLAENLHYLRHELGIVRIEKVLKCFPLVLNLSLPNLEEKVRQLRLAGLGPASEVLERSPFVLSARASEIQRKVELVKRLLGSSNSADDPILYLRKFPHVLLAQYETMEKTYEGMVKYFGEEDTKRLLRRQPLLLGQNWDGMMDTISKLIDVFGREGAVRIVNQTPTVMAYSWSTIEDKILFVTEVMGRSIAEIVVWPALLTRSLEKRLRPRYEMLRGLLREQQLGLGSMFGCTDEVFRKRYGRKIALLAEREGGAEDGENGGEEEDGGGEKGVREEEGEEKDGRI
ncbi:unnamed protein product [Closterium sp. Yama58-4]|nr:unnamed protein product [Closterium sp. Yama58-4]